MKKIILSTILFMSIGNSNTITKYYYQATDNEMSTYLEKKMYTEAQACVRGYTRSCITLGVGSLADSAWRARELLLYLTPSGVTKKNLKKKLKNKIKKTISSSTRNRSGKQKWNKGEIQILSRRNIKGHQVEIHIDGKRGPHIHLDRSTKNININILSPTGKVRSNAKILSYFPKKLKNVTLIRKGIDKAIRLWKAGIK